MYKSGIEFISDEVRIELHELGANSDTEMLLVLHLWVQVSIF